MVLQPINSRPGGVLERGGHTEASVDLCALAKVTPVAVICELMGPTGHMMARDKCVEFARLFNLPIITVQQIVAYRKANQLLGPLASRTGAVASPVPQGLGPTDPAAAKPQPSTQWDKQVVVTSSCDLPVRISADRVETFKLRVYRSTRDDTGW